MTRRLKSSGSDAQRMIANELDAPETQRGGAAAVNIAGEIVINRPIDVVFDFVADERNEPRYNPRLRRVEQTTPGPIGRGTRFCAETIATMGRTAEMVIEYTDFKRPTRLASSTHMSAMDIHGTLTFDPVPAGTRMRWAWVITPRGLLKLMRPLVARLGKRQERAIWAGLKSYLEQPASPPSRGGVDEK